jgi:hypothetical protein
MRTILREPLPGRRKRASHHARAARLLIVRAPGKASEQVEELQLLLGGVIGDGHHHVSRLSDARTPWQPRGVPIANTRQISLVSVEECSELASILGVPEVDAESLAANLALEGLPALSSLPAATRLQFPSGATIYVTDQNSPCRRSGRLLAERSGRRELEFAFPQLADGRRGLVGIVEREGPIRTGDPLVVVRPHRTLLERGHDSPGHQDARPSR